MKESDLIKGAQLSDNRNYARRNLQGLARLKFWLKIYQGYLKADRRLSETLKIKYCYYGPFKGEFGHFLAHNLPFLMYLHQQGVKITYCGMKLHQPFLVDENKKSIIDDFRPLRDFFSDVAPNSNSTIPPVDVQQSIMKFNDEANSSGIPFWNIGDDFYYWFIHRNWLLKRSVRYLYDLEKAYRTEEESSVCIFARNKGGNKTTLNNGEIWDYEQLINGVKDYFDEVYIVGHPSQSLTFQERDNVRLCITSDNSKILEKCANSRLIITQHSGACYLGEYLNNQTLLIYKGKLPIGSLQNTLRFKASLKNRYPFNYAFTEQEVINFTKNFKNKYETA